MQGKPTGRVIVIGPYLRMRRGETDAPQGAVVRDPEARLDEAAGLARAIDLDVAEAIIAPVTQIRPATYLGRARSRNSRG